MRVLIIVTALTAAACNTIRYAEPFTPIAPTPTLRIPFVMVLQPSASCLIPVSGGYLGAVSAHVIDENGHPVEHHPMTWHATAGQFRAATSTTRLGDGYAELIATNPRDNPTVTVRVGAVERSIDFKGECGRY